jgi:hypothetical protein
LERQRRPIQQPAGFHSRRIKKGTTPKPWLNEPKDPREKWVWIIPLIMFGIGLGIAGLLVYDGMMTVQSHVYCKVYEDFFASGWNGKVWTKEVEVGGFG